MLSTAVGRLFGAAVVVAAFLLTAVGGASPAYAADEIQLSRDGVTYGGSFPGALFDGSPKLIPGGTIAAPLYVRNAGSSAAYVTFGLCAPATANAFWSSIRLRASAPTAAGQWLPGTAAQPCLTLLDGVLLRTGESVRIDSELTLDVAADNSTQSSTLSATFVVTLSGVPGGVAVPPGADPPTRAVILALPPPSATVPPSPATVPLPPATTDEAPEASRPGEVRGYRTHPTPNTVPLGEEFVLLLLLAAVVLGWLLTALIRGARRPQAEEEQRDVIHVSPTQTPYGGSAAATT